MTDNRTTSRREAAGVSLVDGNPAVRHARQIMLRSENYEVRSYATCAALLADPRSRDYPCIILDVEMEDIDGIDLLARMRGSGWQGRGILLDSSEPGDALVGQALRNGDRIEDRSIGDAALLTAIAASLNYDKI